MDRKRNKIIATDIPALDTVSHSPKSQFPHQWNEINYKLLH